MNNIATLSEKDKEMIKEVLAYRVKTNSCSNEPMGLAIEFCRAFKVIDCFAYKNEEICYASPKFEDGVAN